MTVLDRPVTIELVYDRQCPNVDRAREMIRAALQELGVDPVWREWERDSIDTPVDRREFASPTVLINGRDVCDPRGVARPDANACRVYVDANGCLCGAPSSGLIIDAINAGLSDG